MINVKNRDSNIIKINKKSFQNSPIYYIGYVLKINSLNPLYLIKNINDYIE